MEAEIRRKEGTVPDSRADVIAAFAPYVIIIAILSIAQSGPIKDALASVTHSFSWPGLDVLNAKGKAPSSLTYNVNWANAAGSLLLVAGLLTMLVLRISPGRALRLYGETLVQLKWATLTVATVLALAYVMNLSGADADDRQLDRRRGRRAGLVLVDHRLARRRGHRLGHLLELAVRRRCR